MNKTTNTTTKERQIEFMHHLRANNFTLKEIAKIYDVNPKRIDTALNSQIKKIKRLKAWRADPTFKR